MPDHYFFSFLWRRLDAEAWQPVEAMTVNEHPLDYLSRARAANEGHEFRLLFFTTIPADVYARSA